MCVLKLNYYGAKKLPRIILARLVSLWFVLVNLMKKKIVNGKENEPICFENAR